MCVCVRDQTTPAADSLSSFYTSEHFLCPALRFLLFLSCSFSKKRFFLLKLNPFLLLTYFLSLFTKFYGVSRCIWVYWQLKMRIKIKLVGLVNRKKVEKQVLSRQSERPASFFSSSFCVPFVSANSVYQSERGNCCAAVYTAGVFAFNKIFKKRSELDICVL